MDLIRLHGYDKRINCVLITCFIASVFYVVQLNCSGNSYTIQKVFTNFTWYIMLPCMNKISHKHCSPISFSKWSPSTGVRLQLHTHMPHYITHTISASKHISELFIIFSNQGPLQNHLTLFVLLGSFLCELVHPTNLCLKWNEVIIWDVCVYEGAHYTIMHNHTHSALVVVEGVRGITLNLSASVFISFCQNRPLSSV